MIINCLAEDIIQVCQFVIVLIDIQLVNGQLLIRNPLDSLKLFLFSSSEGGGGKAQNIAF